jgi:predicted nicotinamide N-methyase
MLDHDQFITSYTRLQYLSFVPEIRLFLRNDKVIYEFLQQELGEDTPYPFWACAWAGGLALARYILENPDIVKDKQVVDYCSGSGIVGIAAALSGATRVTCVDIDKIALSSVKLNARANKVDVAIAEAFTVAEVVLSGDPDPKPLIFDTMKTQQKVFIGCPVRKQELLVGFEPIMSYNITTDEFVSGNDIHIYRN